MTLSNASSANTAATTEHGKPDTYEECATAIISTDSVLPNAKRSKMNLQHQVAAFVHHRTVK